jgi:hypothetical protein
MISNLQKPKTVNRKRNREKLMAKFFAPPYKNDANAGMAGVEQQSAGTLPPRITVFDLRQSLVCQHLLSFVIIS